MTANVLPSDAETLNQVNDATPHAFPAHIEPFKWSELGFVWQGSVPVVRFKRVAEEVVPPLDQQVIQLDCKLSSDDRKIGWLTAKVSANLPLTCQRCLDAVEFALEGQIRLALLDDDRKLQRLTSEEREEVDYVLMSEAQITHGMQLDVLDVLEDEILLLLPLSPKHDDCELAVASVGDDVGLVEEKQPNPFGVLAALKLKD